MTSNGSIKNKRSKLKSSDPSVNQNDGRDLIEETFSPQKWMSFWKL